jgi:peptide-methionine (S)-S-oxide reductase
MRNHSSAGSVIPRMKNFLLAFASIALIACSAPAPKAEPAPPIARTGQVETAVFAGGCFWCAEHDLEAIPGVIDVVSGYTGGTLANPTYENHEGHVEAVRVEFDPGVISYRNLTDRFWRLVDPTDAGGQFCDRGPAYATAVFVTPQQREMAEASKAQAQAALGKPIVTPIREAALFTDAEDYHQDYSKKNPVRYSYYRNGCGRDQRLRQVWGDQAKK